MERMNSKCEFHRSGEPSGLAYQWPMKTNNTHENHAVELSSNEIMDSKLNYIHENPIRAGWVERGEDYLYSSARNYAGLKGY